jgi:Glycosyl hydrolase catalytic core
MSATRKPRLALMAVSLIAPAVAASALIVASPDSSAAARPAAAAYTEPAAPTGLHARTPDHTRANFKKGVGAWYFRGARRALAKSGVSWYYTWAVNHPGITTPRGVSFVPMIWGAGNVTARQLRLARHQGHILLTFNEPDFGSQSNMTVTEALRLWPKLMATKMRLSSPAVAVGGATPNGWLDRFMSRAAHRHYRVNFITLHWYGGDFTTSDAVSQLQSYIQAVWNRYHKPIWLTEFALWRFNPSVFPTPSQQAAFVTAATAMLRKLPYVWRYAWFALPADHADGTAGLFRPGAVPTAAGRAFEKVP